MKVSWIAMLLALIVSCNYDRAEVSQSKSNEHSIDNDDLFLDTNLIDIKYDFDQLNLKLNSKIIDSFWKWDHMNSNGKPPDSNRVSHFENRSQQSFSFDGELTLPALSITTYKNRIVAFEAGTVFPISDKSDKNLERLFDSLKNYEILSNKEVRLQLKKNQVYIKPYDNWEERIYLRLPDRKYGQGVIGYNIQIISSLNKPFKDYPKS